MHCMCRRLVNPLLCVITTSGAKQKLKFTQRNSYILSLTNIVYIVQVFSYNVCGIKEFLSLNNVTPVHKPNNFLIKQTHL